MFSTSNVTPSHRLLDDNYVSGCVQHLGDCEDANCPRCPFEHDETAHTNGDLVQRYANRLSNDPTGRALAREQARRIQRAAHQPAPSSGNGDPTSQHTPAQAGSGDTLVSLIEAATGTEMNPRSNGTMTGACPWHSSRSGTCLVVWPDEQRWWCSSCRRGGDIVQFVALRDGTDRDTSRRRLRIPRTRQ